MEFTNTRFGKCEIADINQGQLEAWQELVKDATNDPLAVFYGKAVRAALKSGVLIEPVLTDDQIKAAKPGMIHWLANCIADVIYEASRIDPLS